MHILTVLIFTYLFCSIPFGLIYGKLFFKKDIREVGSGNVGATNAFRLGGKKLAALTFISDFLKGFICVYAMYLTADDIMFCYLASVTAIIGHIFPIWLGFRGGKGFATTIGALFVINPLMTFNLVLIWLIIFKYYQISAVATVIASALMPILALVYDESILWTFVIGLIVISAHYKNIYEFFKSNI